MHTSGPIEGRGTLVFTGLFQLVIGAALTGFCYFLVRLVASSIWVTACLNHPWLARAIAGAFGLAGFCAAWSTTENYWTEAKFDTTDGKEQITPDYLSPLDGYWSVNPLGPQSMGTVNRIIALPFTIGPRMVLGGLGDLWRAVRGG